MVDGRPWIDQRRPIPLKDGFSSNVIMFLLEGHGHMLP